MARKDVFAHASESKGAQSYDALVEELVQTGFIESRPPSDAGVRSA